MSNETKRDVFEEFANDCANECDGPSDETYNQYMQRYDTALPDDLPVIPKCVSEELRSEYGKNSLLDELVWASQDALPSSEISEWINSNEAIFGEAWSRGLWKVKETGEIVKLDVTKL